MRLRRDRLTQHAGTVCHQGKFQGDSAQAHSSVALVDDHAPADAAVGVFIAQFTALQQQPSTETLDALYRGRVACTPDPGRTDLLGGKSTWKKSGRFTISKVTG